MERGTPSWSMEMLGSPEMTVLAEKSTRLPMRFPLTRPSLPCKSRHHTCCYISQNCLVDQVKEFIQRPSAMIEGCTAALQSLHSASALLVLFIPLGQQHWTAGVSQHQEILQAATHL